MLYNRYSYALLGLVVLECFQPGEGGWLGGISTGLASAALLFLKPSYCLVALGFAACSMIMQHPRPQRLLGITIGLLGRLPRDDGLLAIRLYRLLERSPLDECGTKFEPVIVERSLVALQGPGRLSSASPAGRAGFEHHRNAYGRCW